MLCETSPNSTTSNRAKSCQIQLEAFTCPKSNRQKNITKIAKEKTEFLDTEYESLSCSKLPYVIIAGLT